MYTNCIKSFSAKRNEKKLLEARQKNQFMSRIESGRVNNLDPDLKQNIPELAAPIKTTVTFKYSYPRRLGQACVVGFIFEFLHFQKKLLYIRVFVLWY